MGGIRSKIRPELDENWLTYFSFLVDLTTHFNELNICLNGESELIDINPQLTLMFQLKLKLQQLRTSEILGNPTRRLNTFLWTAKPG